MNPIEHFSQMCDTVFGVTTGRVEPAGQRVRCTDCGRSVLDSTVLRTDERTLCQDCAMGRLFSDPDAEERRAATRHHFGKEAQL